MLERLTHVLVECPDLIASVQVGVLNVLAPLEGTICEVRFRETRRIRRKDIQWCDILICVRGCEVSTAMIISEAKRHGRLVFYFLDDDLLHLPEDSLARAYLDYKENQQSLLNIIGQSDGLWGVNEEIRKIYLPLCGIQRWICTRVPTQLREMISYNVVQNPVKILYAGSMDHQNIVHKILAPAVRMVIERCGEKVDFTFVGPDPQLPGYTQVHHHAFFPDYKQYRNFVESGSYQIGLAPIKQSQFYQCKYYNKFVEYTSIGAVGIYTDSPLYGQIVTHGENGFLSKNDPVSWAEWIIQFVEHPELRQSCFQNAAELLSTQFRPEIVSEKLLQQMSELREFRAPKVLLLEISIFNPWFVFYAERVKYLFHRYHILAVPILAFKAMRKMAHWVLRGIWRND